MADQCIVCLENLDVEPSAAPQFPSDPDGSPPAAGTAATVVAATSSTKDISISDSTTTTNTQQNSENHDHVALIQVCGHMLHNSCLREWTEKANSCPICRQTFYQVQVYDKVGGNLLSSYKVEDKKQVAEFDFGAWLDENPDEEEAQIPCPVCNSADQEEILLICDGCDTPYHTHCIGLDSIPPGPWFCMECVDALGPEVIEHVESPSSSAASRPRSRNNRQRNGRYYFPRTQASMRRARQQARSDEWQGAWGRITGRVWDALNLDLDYHDDDDTIVWEGYRRSQQLRERERQEHQRWQQRLNIASRLGAREVFENNIPAVYQHPRRTPPRPQPPRETREEQIAWGAFERARDIESPGRRKRKSRSASAERSGEPQEQPERKLKRPRTRRVQAAQNAAQNNGEASSASTSKGPVAAAASSSNQQTNQQAGEGSSAPSNAGPSSLRGGGGGGGDPGPSFLSSLLKEVEMSAGSDEESLRSIFGPIPGVNDGPLSPAASPSASGYSSPRATSSTPPPNNHSSTRPTSPQLSLSSHIEPIYPPANYSPVRSSSPTKKPRAIDGGQSSPESSDTELYRRTRIRSRVNGGASSSNGAPSSNDNASSSSSSELRQPRPRRSSRPIVPQLASRSQDISPARGGAGIPAQLLPLEMKESISNIVRLALKPHWRSNQLTEQQYATINRDVSRKIYEEVKDPRAASAISEDIKRGWEKMATKEVARAIADLKA